MLHENKPHNLSYRSPEEVQAEVLEADVAFSIDGAWGCDKILRASPLVPQMHLFSVELGTSTFSFLGRRGGVICHAGGLQAGNEVVSSLKERFDHLPAGVVGIGNEYRRSLQAADDLKEECCHFVEESSFVAVGPDQALVDPAGERNAKELTCSGIYEQSDGLEGVPHDEGWFGIVLGLLVKVFDAGHLLSFLGGIESVADEEGAAVDGDGTEEAEGESDPESCELAKCRIS